LHADDAANAFVVAAERMTSAEDTSLSGVYHVVENSSTTMGDVLQSLAAGIGASPPSSFSPWMASFILGFDSSTSM
jgi:nucleoside-diphosphate-sugar epimerase